MDRRKMHVLKWIFKKYDRACVDVAQVRDKYPGLVDTNEISGSIKCKLFLDKLRNY